jgi:hypothetical protein
MSPLLEEQLQQDGAEWVAWIEVAGWGRRTGALTADQQRAYRFSTRHPVDLGTPADEAECYVDVLDVPDEVFEESISLRDGKTSLGAASFDLVDLGPRLGDGHGWRDDLLTHLIGVGAPAGQWRLTADITADDTEIPLAGAALSAGQALWVGSEVVIVVDPELGPGVVSVLRGCYNTVAAVHRLLPFGEGVFYDRPQFLTGLRVDLWVNLLDDDGVPLTAVGGANDHGEAVRAWSGTLENWQLHDDFNGFELLCQPSLGRIDRSLGRQQYCGTAVFGVDWQGYGAIARAMAAGRPLVFTVDRPEAPGQLAAPDYPVVDGHQRFHARLGDQLVEVRYTPATGEFRVEYWGLLDTPLPTEDDAEQVQGRWSFWDVVLTAPDPGGLPVQRFTDEGGNPFCHPALLALATITSTGAAVSGATPNGGWDCLPATWGAGVPEADVDVDSFLDLAGAAAAAVQFPRLVLGWKGEPQRLRDWLETDVMGPLGWFLYLDEAGRIAAGALREQYPGDVWPELTEEDDILRDGHVVLVRLAGQLDTTTSYQTWRLDFDWVTDQPRRILRYRHAQVIERSAENDTDITRELRGLAPSSDAQFIIRSLALTFARFWTSPPSALGVTIDIRRLATSVTDGVLFSCQLVPNHWTGERGFVRHPCAVVSRAIDLQRSRIRLTLLPLPTPNVRLVAPSALVTGWDAATLTLTLSENRYTSPDAPAGAPVRDALGFVEGNKLRLHNLSGVVLANNVPAVAVVEPGAPDVLHELQLTEAFTMGGVPVDPTGRVIGFCRYQGGATPAAAWTEDMQRCAVMGSRATGLLPNGDAPVVFGGF